jgi:hypothetical protein
MSRRAPRPSTSRGRVVAATRPAAVLVGPHDAPPVVDVRTTSQIALDVQILSQLLFGRIAEGTLPQLDGHVVVKRAGVTVYNCYSDYGKALRMAETAKAFERLNDPAMAELKRNMDADLRMRLEELTPPDFMTNPARVGVYIQTSESADQKRLSAVFKRHIVPFVYAQIDAVLKRAGTDFRTREWRRQVIATVAAQAPWDTCTCLAALHLYENPHDTVEFVSMGFVDTEGGGERQQEYPMGDGEKIRFKVFA